MSTVELLLIAFTAGCGAVLTAVAGLGGGILLLSVMVQFMDPAEAIPAHAAIQLASNSSRAVILRASIRSDVVWRFCLLLLPAGALGLLLVDRMPSSAGRVAIACFALVAVWRPAVLATTSRWFGSGLRGFVPLGAVAGFLNMPFGVTGPAVAPMFRRVLENRTQMIATFAATQTIGHLAKLLLFGLDGYSFVDDAVLIAASGAAVVAGSWVGTRLLHRTSEGRFDVIFRTVLTLVALRVILDAIW